MAEKRVMTKHNSSNELQIVDLILVAVLLAAGIVLRFLSTSFSFFGMKPNFMIAMYCLAILLIRPKLVYGAIIGLIAGALCQVNTPSPFLNLYSELFGAVVMCLLIRVPMQAGKINLTPIVSTFVSTIVSGGSFVVGLFLFYHMEASAMAAYVPIVLGTAIINTIIVYILYLPLKTALQK